MDVGQTWVSWEFCGGLESGLSCWIHFPQWWLMIEAGMEYCSSNIQIIGIMLKVLNMDAVCQDLLPASPHTP